MSATVEFTHTEGCEDEGAPQCTVDRIKQICTVNDLCDPEFDEDCDVERPIDPISTRIIKPGFLKAINPGEFRDFTNPAQTVVRKRDGEEQHKPGTGYCHNDNIAENVLRRFVQEKGNDPMTRMGVKTLPAMADDQLTTIARLLRYYSSSNYVDIIYRIDKLPDTVINNNVNHQPLLYTAASVNAQGIPEVVQLLLKKGADPNKGIGDDTPLRVAVRQGHWNSVELLTDELLTRVWKVVTEGLLTGDERIQDIVTYESDGAWSPILNYAAKIGRVQVVDTLVETIKDLAETDQLLFKEVARTAIRVAMLAETENSLVIAQKIAVGFEFDASEILDVWYKLSVVSKEDGMDMSRWVENVSELKQPNTLVRLHTTFNGKIREHMESFEGLTTYLRETIFETLYARGENYGEYTTDYGYKDLDSLFQILDRVLKADETVRKAMYVLKYNIIKTIGYTFGWVGDEWPSETILNNVFAKHFEPVDMPSPPEWTATWRWV